MAFQSETARIFYASPFIFLCSPVVTFLVFSRIPIPAKLSIFVTTRTFMLFLSASIQTAILGAMGQRLEFLPKMIRFLSSASLAPFF